MADTSLNNGMRKLNQGATAIINIEEDYNLNVEYTSVPRSLSGNRRRSSFGGIMLGSRSPHKSGPDQARLAEMYKVIIKMSSENKINAKNSWDLNLIDHMGQLIKEEAAERGQRGVNFQKASCTLDASVKIYSHRVDDTWTSSYRILENLSRNANNDDEDTENKGPARVGSKSISIKNGITSTIESNKALLNVLKLESDYNNADPMFHKMSQAFDEGGAKGMLMNNLRVVTGSSTLVFTSQNLIDESNDTKDTNIEPDQEKNELSPENENCDSIDVTDILLKSGITLSGLQSSCIVPILDEYRNSIGIKSSISGLFDYSGFSHDDFDASIELKKIKKPDIISNSSDSDFYDCDFEKNDNCEGYNLDDDADDNSYTDGIDDYNEKKDFQQAKEPVDDKLNKFDFNTIFVSKESEDAKLENNEIKVGNFNVEIGNDYTFFNFTSNQANFWAGARHWKFGPKKNIQLATSSSNEETCVEKSNQGSKKQKFSFSFSSKIDFGDLFKVDEDKKALRHQITASAMEKAAQLASEGAYELPIDEKLCPKDLCRLFSCYNIIVPPPNLKSIMSSSSFNNPSNLQLKPTNRDLFWGEFQSSSKGNLKNVTSDGNDHDVDENGSADYFYNDDNDDEDDNNDFNRDHNHIDNDTSNEPDPEGLQINLNGMLKANRIVKKVSIGYSTVSKRVNLKNLKSEIWEWVDQSCSSKEDTENVNPNLTENQSVDKKRRSMEKPQTASFQNMISNLAVNQQNKEGQEVSVSYYFICLLHLANEKGLKIMDQTNFSDLKILKDF